ncbi:MAG: hypothetical protein HC810_02680 [Acaryochloridaceae cyanobacterium RL_2_7]|nr:hypothetical protein [Acaryochloridaceae cyanobacterium RL_2_7]
MDKQQKLAMLMQPALIRLIDQLRQQLTAASLKWTYETTELWPNDVPQTLRQQYQEMTEALEIANDDDADKIYAVLETLPQPVPLYRLEIEQGNEKLYEHVGAVLSNLSKKLPTRSTTHAGRSAGSRRLQD